MLNAKFLYLTNFKFYSIIYLDKKKERINMFIITYILDDRMNRTKCNDKEVLITSYYNLITMGAKIVRIQNEFGDSINIDLT